MFHMLTSFNLKPGVSLEDYAAAVARFSEHMKSVDLLHSTGPIGNRQKHGIMDTDERNHAYFFISTFLDRKQCDNAVDYIIAREEPGASIHKEVFTKVVDQVFTCWEDVGPD